MIQSGCNTCGMQFTFPPEMAGTACQCTSCGNQIAVPMATAQISTPVPFQCGQCGSSFAVPYEMAGGPVQCQQCGNMATPAGASMMPGQTQPMGGVGMPANALVSQTVQQPLGSQPGFGKPAQTAPAESSNRGLVIGAGIGGGILGLLVIIGIAAFVFRGGGSSSPGVTQSATASRAVGGTATPNNTTSSTNTPSSTITPSSTNTSTARPAPRQVVKDELDPKRFPQIQLAWSLSGQPSGAGDTNRLRERVTETLRLRGVEVVGSSSKKMNVSVSPGPSKSEQVRIFNTGENFSVNVPSYTIKISYTDGSATLWTKNRDGRSMHPSIPTFINSDNPQQYVQDHVTKGAWSIVESIIRTSIPFPLSQHELDQLAEAEARREVQKAKDTKKKRSALAAKVNWSVKPAPWTKPISAAAPMPLDVSVNNLQEARFCDGGSGRMLAMSQHTHASGTDESNVKHVGVYEVASGKQIGDITLSEPSLVGGLVDDGKSLVVARGNVVEVIGVENGSIVRQWELDEVDTIIWVRSAGDWVFTRTDTLELSAWDAATGQRKYSVANIERSVLSPTGTYLVVSEKHGPLFPGHIYDAATGRVAGNLTKISSSSRITPLSKNVAFSLDGTKLIEAGISERRGWDLTTGASIGAIPRMYGSGEFGFVSDQIMLCGNNLFTFGEDRYIWSLSSVGRIKAIDPSGQVWLAIGAGSTANGYLVAFRVPENEVLTYIANNRSSSGSLRAGRTSFDYDDLMRGGGFTMPGQDPSLPTRPTVPPNLYNTFVSTILADDQKIAAQLKWLPGAKQPSFGERWGVGVLVKGSRTPTRVRTFTDFGNMTGEIGTAFVSEINRRATSGEFGNWAAGNATPLAAAVLVTGTDQDLILKNARDQDLDTLALFNVTQILGRTNRVEDAELTIEFHDVHGRRTEWKTDTVRSSRVIAAKGRGEDKVKEFVDSVTARIDSEYRLTTMPNITAEIAASRVVKLTNSTTASRPHALAEIRFYHAKKLIDDAAASAAYAKILGAENGEKFTSSDVTERQKIITTWLLSQRN